MNTREQFGKYLLLKKLTEDPLGETFRAGLVGSGGMERVALLRIFNGQGIDGSRLWESVKDRGQIQEVLKSPNIGEGVELGEIEGIPYVAYDYVSGKNMANLLEQAARQRNFVPAEHALLITERLALALSSAAETRFGNERIFHGFLVPHLVIISNEGETRLLGFEVGPGLRTFAANPVVRQHFGRYMSPETLSGAPADKVDDIYSLGVVLFELLTGRPLPPPAQDGYASIIDQGVVATEGEPIPGELRELLKKSLVPREQRFKDVVEWHKALNKYMFEGEYNPTTFNLAFFMHNLFRQEIERESQEIEIEKTLPVPTRAGKAAEADSAKVDEDGTEAGDATGASQAVPVGEPSGIHQTVPPEKSSKTGLIIGAIAALLLLAVGGFFFLQGDDPGEATAAQEAPAEPQGPSPEEIRAQIEELAAKQSEMMQQQFEETQEKLLQQLAEAQERQAEAEERRRREAEARREAEKEAAEREAELEAQKEADAEAAKLAEERAAEKKAEEAAAAKEAEAEAKLAAAEEKKKPPTPTPAVPTPTPTPGSADSARQGGADTSASEPQVRRGDLVEMGPGVVQPEPLRKPRATFPEMARRFNRQGATVLVRALIDENGRVVKTELASAPQKFGFDQEAVSAVEKSLYKPATKDGVPVKFWHTIAVKFGE